MSWAGWLRLMVVAGAVLLLEVLCRAGAIAKTVLPAPSVMAGDLYRLLASGAASADIGETLSNVALSVIASILLGFVGGVAIHAMPRVRRALDPFLATYYAVPFFVFYPVLIVIFGLGAAPIVVIGTLFGVVAMLINTLNGLDRIPRVLLKTARVHGMDPVRTALLIKLPSAAPFLFTGAKLAIAYCFIGVIAAEFIMSSSGIGYSIAYAFNNFDNARMYALMLFIIVLVTALNAVLFTWERRIMQRRRR